MGVIHFLNVLEGDCSWIQHLSGHNTIIDVCNARKEEKEKIFESFSTKNMGNHHQKEHPINPIEYFHKFNLSGIFRFILTHPDMDHLDGIKDLFEEFEVINFWDTENNKEMDENSDWGKYRKEDWDYYQTIRKKDKDPIVLHLYSGAKNKYFNQDSEGKSGGDGLYILAPTKELLQSANDSGKYNDASYVILYRMGNGKKVIFAGDSEDKTWDYILEEYEEDVKDIDILIAPHHGRKTGGNDDYLDILNPKLTLFGNAKSENLDYSSWNNKGLEHITNNQANCVVMDINAKGNINIYVTNENFAKKKCSKSFYDKKYQAWHIMTI